MNHVSLLDLFSNVFLAMLVLATIALRDLSDEIPSPEDVGTCAVDAPPTMMEAGGGTVLLRNGDAAALVAVANLGPRPFSALPDSGRNRNPTVALMVDGCLRAHLDCYDQDPPFDDTAADFSGAFRTCKARSAARHP